MLAKALGGFAASVVIVPVALIATLGGGATAPRASCTDVEVVLSTIRTMESANRYDARAKGSSASGAYQIIDSTWGMYGGFLHAADAPPAIQDERARAMAEAIIAEHGVEMVPVGWYWPKAINDPTQLDIVPYPEINELTVRGYQTRWLALLHETGDCGQWASPIDSPISELAGPHHDYPAVDIGGAGIEGRELRAIHDGTITRTTHESGNCWGHKHTCTSICGLGLTIDIGGALVSYCHLSRLDVALGEAVRAGQVVGAVGNTGHSSGAHLHLGIQVNGARVCPQPLLVALAQGEEPPPIEALPTTGCIGPSLG